MNNIEIPQSILDKINNLIDLTKDEALNTFLIFDKDFNVITEATDNFEANKQFKLGNHSIRHSFTLEVKERLIKDFYLKPIRKALGDEQRAKEYKIKKDKADKLKDSFKTELDALLKKYNADISFECDDTQGIQGEAIVIEIYGIEVIRCDGMYYE